MGDMIDEIMRFYSSNHSLLCKLSKCVCSIDSQPSQILMIIWVLMSAGLIMYSGILILYTLKDINKN